MLSKETIKSLLKPDAEVFVFDEINSTNTFAKELVKKDYDKNALIVASMQTNGRGRQGKEFYSPDGSGLYMTCLLNQKLPLDGFAFITTCACVAVCMVLEEYNISPLIKWVNDIYVDDKKVCGILVEASNDFENKTINSLIIGIGINLTTKAFPKELENIASSLNLKESRDILSAKITNKLFEIILSDDKSKYFDYYISHSFVIGKDIIFIQNNTETPAKAVGIDQNGGLIAELEDGTQKTLTSGEISVKRRFDNV